MDDIRDIQSGNFSKFLDSEVRTDPFGENRTGERLYRRAERVVAAIFLLTNHIDQVETIRRDIRSSATNLLSNILDLRQEMRSAPSVFASEFQSTIRRLISLTRMLVFGGFVSSQNAEAVSGALDDLGNSIGLAQRTHLSETIRISREELLQVPEYRKGQIRDIKDRAPIKDKETVKDTSLTAISAPQTSIMTARASGIVEILRTGGQMNIRDIAAHLPEYGEKTIQRELNLLISGGLIRRTGLKRWSVYSIAQ